MKWSCPPRGYIKVNVDGAFDLNNLTRGVGMVARDEHGKFVAGRRFKCAGSFFQITTELIAIGVAVQWVEEEGWSKVIIELDAHTTVCGVLDLIGLSYAPLLQMILDT
ncbi:unnamed protein product [Cuscuta europaea]|uniref:RNase H type-1 domain-containing protein n=1 Tax=Cuscuta europaea TaxID=41803 RepID=A0A9P0Z0E2_CUSEU|nr:unnamed protein product [Cuscuta europaea]